MALRIRVELIPHGNELAAEVLDEIIVANNGTGEHGGADEGGVGNYDIYDQRSIGELHAHDEPWLLKDAEIRGIPRALGHRIIVAEQALEAVVLSRKAKGEL